MAIKIYEKFAPRANPADGDYPYGSIKNESVPGAKDGTPLDAVWANDYAGTDVELFAQAGIVPNGQPDKLGASQRVDAMRKIFTNAGTVADIAAGKFKAGALVSVTDRAGGIFTIVSGGTADGYGILDAGNGNTAVVTGEDVYNLASYGTDSAAFDSARGLAVDNSTIYLPPVTHTGTFANQFEELAGEGTASLMKGDSVNPVLTIKRKTSSLDWDFYKVSNMAFDGEGASSCVEFDPVNAFAGRMIFDNVQFKNGESGVRKPLGSIGDGYYNCNFRGQDYGWNASSSASPVMHSGAVLFQQTNFDIIEKACVKVVDNVDGPGQISLRDSLMQGCNGFGVFMNLNDYVPVCPPLLDHQWLELVAKNATTEIDGVTYTTRELRYEKTPYAVVKGTYVKTMELVSSVVHLSDCRLDDAAGAFADRYVADNNSLMLVDNVYGNGEIGGVPFVRSIANQTNTAATKSCTVRGPLKHNRIRLTSLSNATNICSNSYAGTGPWTFTGTSSVAATQVSDGVLGDTCAQLIVPNGATLLSAENGTPVNGTWAVFGIHAKKVSGGEFTRARIGQNWVAGKVHLKQNEWTCSYGIKKVASTGTCRLEFVNNSGAAITVRLADFFCVTFATFREALEFVNSGMAIRNDV